LVADAWPDRRVQRVSVALSPRANRIALSVGPLLSVSDITSGALGQSRLQRACALAPGLTWSPDGDRFAFRDEDGQARLVDLSERVPVTATETRTQALGAVTSLAFVPGGARLAMLGPSEQGRMTLKVVEPDRTVIWERTLTRNQMSGNFTEGVNLAVSPDGSMLACTAGTSTVWMYETAGGEPVRQFDDHTGTVTGLSWIDDEWIVSASLDATLKVWHPDDSVPSTVVETIEVAGMVFVRERRTALIWSAARGELLAWSLDGTPAQLWYRDPPPPSVAAHFTRLAVSAVDGLMALVDPGAAELLLIRDWDRVVSAPAVTTTYANAKVLLLGDSGVGKSGLAMVLAGEPFQPTDSTQGRRIWRLPLADETDSSAENRDVLLWDLAGQPGYRIVHQLHLEGADLALILFDAKSETAPLAGVQHWARAVRHAHPATAGGLTTFLVAARADRGGINVSDQRIRKLMADFGLDDYFKTSALEGTNVGLLRSRLLAAINWTRIPEVTSTTLFAAVKQFVMSQKSISASLMTPLDELCRMFQQAVPKGQQLLIGEQPADAAGNDSPELASARLTSVFEGCIARLESAGLVKRLKFGDYVLLQPELLDTYAGAIVNAARDEPDGFGCIMEANVVGLDFAVPSAGRLAEERQERLLVCATLEELVQHELVLREPTEDGVQLVFPSAYRRDLPPSETPKGDGVVFRFEGPVENVYATLIVRLTRSNRFTRVDSWQSAARFAADGGGECTIAVKDDGEGKAELWIGYDRVPDELRKQFERFVHVHLDRRATPGSVARERQYSCPHDGTAFTAEQVQRVLRLGRLDIRCPVCENIVSLRDDYELANGSDQQTAAMDASADAGRDSAAAAAVLRGKEEAAEFDVFLCHNWKDKPSVRDLARRLRARGLRPWLDERQLRPGEMWQPALEEVIAKIPAAAVIIGSEIGPWQMQELAAFLRQRSRRRCAVVPVLLPGPHPDNLPVFLDALTWVDLAVAEPDPIDRLVWGITGEQEDSA
jgi:GTPase SAR1 family protein